MAAFLEDADMEPQIFARRNRDRHDRYMVAAENPDPRTPMHRFVSACFILALGAAPAIASQQGVVVLQKWKGMDLCAKQAQAAFPDFTAEANAKRDEKMRECLEGQNLPPRAVPGPQQP
jgi:hypothetical protein